MPHSTDCVNTPAFRQAVQDLLAAAGFRDGFTLHPLAGGRNNRVFRLDVGTTPVVLKAYFRHPQDPRDRLRAEFAFSTFAWRHGVRALPRPLGCDPANGLGLYAFAAGRRLQPGEVTGSLVGRAVEFFAEVNRHRHEPDAQALLPASEACFNLAEHLGCVERRLRRLQSLDDPSPLGREARRFIRHELSPAWHDVVTTMARRAAGLGLEAWDSLAPADRCLSPSDFGFHNALVGPDGGCCFVDFEYAGWDDPAKMICDFFCQPAVSVPRMHSARVIHESARGQFDVDRLDRRVQLLLPVYELKWCSILLNDFLPAGDCRRGFADGESSPQERKAGQLEKARQFLQRHTAQVA